MRSLIELMGETATQVPVTDKFFERFGLGRNPFPPTRTIIPQILYNQQDAITKFASRVKDLLQSEPQRRSLGVIGGTGGGKTHFLRHCQYLMADFEKESGHRFVIVEFPAGTGSVVQLVREVIRRADEQSRERGEIDLLTALVRKSDSDETLGVIRQPDLKSVMGLLIRACAEGFVPPDRDRALTFDSLREIAKKWLSASALTQTERKYLGVFSRLATPSMAARVLGELLTLARRLNVFDGALICIDELEALFTSGLSTGRIQGFLQDLRYMFDDAVKGGEGYSLLVIGASTGPGSVFLRDLNYPLYQRLGLEGDGRASLQQIADADDARSFADTYIDFECRRASEADVVRHSVSVAESRSLLSDEDIKSAYAAAVGANLLDGRIRRNS